MPKCSLGCGTNVIYARTAASGGKSTMPVNAVPVPHGTAWFENIDGKNLLVVASAEHPKPATGRFFRLHNIDCGPHKMKKSIESALKRAARAEVSS